jgi:hypothetical protein
MMNLFEKSWGWKDEIVVDHAVELTLPVMSSVRNRYIFTISRSGLRLRSRFLLWLVRAWPISLGLKTHCSRIIAFGSSMDMIEEGDDAPLRGQHKMSVKQALKIVAKDMWIKLAVPEWALGLHPRFRRMRTAFSEVKVPMDLFFTTNLFLMGSSCVLTAALHARDDP